MARSSSTPGPGENRLLQLLPEADRDLLRPHLQQVVLSKDEVYIEPFRRIEHAHFLESGLSSSVFPDAAMGTSEIGMQGYEGFMGVPALLGVDSSPHKVFMQVGGSGQRIAIAALRQAMEKSPSLRDLLVRYAYVFLVQTAQTAHVNARFQIPDRLARWILMAADRLGPQVALTHDYLSLMLGTRRSGVTEGLHILEGEHLVRCTRGQITVTDREGLQVRAGKGYGVPEAEYERLIGPILPHPLSAQDP
jgi:CRP-like cAMP-binding protein